MPGSVAERLAARAKALEEAPATGMVSAARAVKGFAAEEAARVAPRGVKAGKRRRKLRARDNIRRHGTTVNCRVQGLPAGPWVWITDGTTAHQVGGKRRRGSKGPRNKGRYLKAPGYKHGVWGPVDHPGGRGAGAWRRVQDRAARVVPVIFADQVSEAVN